MSDKQPALFTSLASQQGLVPGVKEYAANHASTEEAKRKSKALTDVLRSENSAKAKRDFAEATYNKVLSAAEQHMSARKQKAEVESGAPSSAPLPGSAAASASGPVGVNPSRMLMSQRKVLLSAGFGLEAEKVEAKVEQFQADG
eukprot:42929-Prymnesium_polylepis.1